MRLPIPPDRVDDAYGRLLGVDGFGETMRLPIPPDRVVMLGRLLEVDGFGETMRLPAPLDRVVMLDRFMDGDTVLGMDRFARLLDERVILEAFDALPQGVHSPKVDSQRALNCETTLATSSQQDQNQRHPLEEVFEFWCTMGD